ncbi:hypothetical protein BP5796_07178 [Coleophoma crateriformis]|uniref:BTB domain transcription factor n=1 Tax=Coleophoma crateriformis TaxID=565419 RepID=A0A3D8RIF4_9HELO|nr:hypothetical protein BP5796_07178 [Coleophoma crateriformis]
MPTTRSSQGSSAQVAQKRSAPDTSSTNKKAKIAKDQKTIEETINNAQDAVEEEDAIEEQIAGAEKNGDEKKMKELEKRENAVKKREEAVADKENQKKTSQDGDQYGNGTKEKNALDEVKADTDDVAKAAKEEEAEMDSKIKANGDSVVEDPERARAIPSSILEKGIIYFFFRGRVGVEDPQGVEDVARSYIVLRPLPLGAKIGDGPLQDFGNARLLALPKKVLPKSKKDRFLVFVEKPKATIKDLKEQFGGSEYATKTQGTSHTPAATPFAEGVYAITSTGRESHLAYHITVPEIGELQKELGLNENGSYVVSVKNPTAPGPANATLSNPAQYPESIQKKFRSLRWMPLEPELLDYENTQFLIIGEGLGDMTKAVEEQSKDQRDESKEKPAEEMEKLEEEDMERVEHLKNDDPVFADLGLSSKQYSKMQTTW